MPGFEKPIEVYWKDTHVSNFNNVTLHPAMFTEYGYRKLGMFQLAKHGRGYLPPKQFCKIIYDREFVIYWFCKKIIEKLRLQDESELNTVIDFLKEAYDRHCQQNQE